MSRTSRSNAVRALLTVAALALTACPDMRPPDQGPDAGPDVSRNRTPILAPIGTIVSDELVEVRIVLSAFDADGDSLSYAGGPLPLGSSFDRQRGLFTWLPALGSSAGSPYPLEFTANDGQNTSRAYGTLVIEPAPIGIRSVFPNRVPQTGGVRITVSGLGFEPDSVLRIAGVAASDVEVLDRQTLRATTPALLNDFGPQLVSLTVPDGRSALLNGGIYLYRDARDLRLGLHRTALPEGAELLGTADLDGLDGVELLASTASGLVAVDPHDLEPPLPLLDEPVVAAVGFDLDGDRVDEAIAITEGGEVWLYRAAADPPLERVHATPPAVAVTAFDLDGDGDLEVVVVDDDGGRWLYPWLNAHHVGAVIPSDGGLVPVGVSTGDFDADGVTDLLYDLGPGFAFARGVETGAFLPAESVSVAADLESATPELREGLGWEVATLDVPGEAIQYFRRNEAGTWLRTRTHTFVPRDGSLWLGDGVGDSVLELLTSDNGRPGLRLDAVVGERLENTSWLMLGDVTGRPLLADFNGDRVDDLGILEADGATFVWVERRSFGALPAAPRGLLADHGLGLRVADYTRDGFVDVVVTGAALDDLPVHLLFQLDSPGLRGSVSIALPASGDLDAVVLADVTGDRWTDILSLDESGRVTCTPALSPSTFGPAVATRFAREAVQLAPVLRVGTINHVAVRFDDGGVLVASADDRCQLALVDRLDTHALRLDTGDLDGDLRDDVIIQTAEGALEVWRAAAGTHYALDANVALGFEGPRALALGDLDGDGRGDVVLAGEDGIEVVASVRFLSPGDATAFVLDTEPADGVVVGDLNGDGADEVVATGGGEAPRIYWLGADDVVVERFPVWHRDARSPFLADLDRDADLDIVTLQPDFGAVIWPNGAAP